MAWRISRTQVCGARTHSAPPRVLRRQISGQVLDGNALPVQQLAPNALAPSSMTAAQKWVEIVVDIVAYEIAHTHDGELLSEACDRWIVRHPIAARVCILVAGALLMSHLANLVHQDYDVVGTTFWRSRGRAWKRFADSEGSILRYKNFRSPPRGDLRNVEA